MTTAIKVLGNIFGVSTFLMMFFGFVTVITGGSFEIEEITFLMFAFFVLTVLIVMGRTKDKQDEKG